MADEWFDEDDWGHEDPRRQQLFLAIWRGDAATVTALANEGVPLDTTSYSSVGDAFSRQHWNLAPLLVGLGAKMTPEQFSKYLRWGHPTRDNLERILAAGIPSSWTLVKDALSGASAPLADVLMTPDAEPPLWHTLQNMISERRWAIRRAIDANQVQVFKRLVDADPELKVLHPLSQWSQIILQEKPTQARMRMLRTLARHGVTLPLNELVQMPEAGWLLVGLGQPAPRLVGALAALVSADLVRYVQRAI